MKALILAAGKGTRLRPLTADRPKPMLPIGDVPLLVHIVSLLKRHGQPSYSFRTVELNSVIIRRRHSSNRSRFQNVNHKETESEREWKT